MKNLGIRTKIYFLYGAILILCITAGLSTFYMAEKIISRYQRFDEVNLPKINSLLKAQSRFRSMHLNLLNLTLTKATKEFHDNSLKQFEEDRVQFDNSISDYVALPFHPGEAELYKKLERIISTIHIKSDIVIGSYKKLKIDNDRDGRKKIVKLESVEIEELIPTFLEAEIALAKYHKDTANIILLEARNAMIAEMKMLFFIVLAGLIIIAALRYALNSSLKQGI